MDRTRKLELIQRSLGLRHKIKVHESMKPPETHEELSLMLLTKWEFEDELRAIEELLTDSRQQNMFAKKMVLESALKSAAGPLPAELKAGAAGSKRASGKSKA